MQLPFWHFTISFRMPFFALVTVSANSQCTRQLCALNCCSNNNNYYNNNHNNKHSLLFFVVSSCFCTLEFVLHISCCFAPLCMASSTVYQLYHLLHIVVNHFSLHFPLSLSLSIDSLNPQLAEAQPQLKCISSSDEKCISKCCVPSKTIQSQYKSLN